MEFLIECPLRLHRHIVTCMTRPIVAFGTKEGHACTVSEGKQMIYQTVRVGGCHLRRHKLLS